MTAACSLRIPINRVSDMWDYPKSAKHRAFIDELQAKHERELAKVRAAEKKLARAADGQQALEEIKAQSAATREKTARLRAERLARAAENLLEKRAKAVRKKK